MTQPIATANIELDPDAYEIFMATRLSYCLATDCRNNALYLNRHGDRPECLLKRTALAKSGGCENYEPNPIEVNP